jgi:hypothetical protein
VGQLTGTLAVEGANVAPTVLVTGSEQRVEEVGSALRAAGADVLSAPGLDRLDEAVKPLRPGSLDCYIQLPVTLRPSGGTVVSRVRDFLEKGLLTRFQLAEAVLPAMSPDGRVVLVGGHTPAEASAPDDEAARIAFLHVLAHALRADKAPAKLRVRVLTGRHNADEIARVALTPEQVRSPVAPPRHPAANEHEMSYADWRTEVLGLATIEF